MKYAERVVCLRFNDTNFALGKMSSSFDDEVPDHFVEKYGKKICCATA